MNQDNHDHWLVRPTTIKKLWWGGSIVLLLTIAAEYIFPIKGYFGVDGLPAFGAWFGFLSCVAMVLVAKALGFFLKRSEGYFDDGADDA